MNAIAVLLLAFACLVLRGVEKFFFLRILGISLVIEKLRISTVTLIYRTFSGHVL